MPSVNNTVFYSVDTKGRFLKLEIVSGNPFSSECSCDVFLKEPNGNWSKLGDVFFPEKIKHGTKFKVSNHDIELTRIYVHKY